MLWVSVEKDISYEMLLVTLNFVTGKTHQLEVVWEASSEITGDHNCRVEVLGDVH